MKLPLLFAFALGLLALSSPLRAQVSLELSQAHHETDQPGMILLLGAHTAPVTLLHLKQVFQCTRFESGYCADYHYSTREHHVLLIIKERLRVPGNMISFHALYDLPQRRYLIKARAFQGPAFSPRVQELDGVTVLTID